MKKFIIGVIRRYKADRAYWRWMKQYRRALALAGQNFDLPTAVLLYISDCSVDEAVTRTLERTTERRSIRRALGD